MHFRSCVKPFKVDWERDLYCDVTARTGVDRATCPSRRFVVTLSAVGVRMGTDADSTILVLENKVTIVRGEPWEVWSRSRLRLILDRCLREMGTPQYGDPRSPYP